MNTNNTNEYNEFRQGGWLAATICWFSSVLVIVMMRSYRYTFMQNPLPKHFVDQ
jgi:hypothetical protein